jgi:hypothetical protein
MGQGRAASTSRRNLQRPCRITTALDHFGSYRVDEMDVLLNGGPAVVFHAWEPIAKAMDRHPAIRWPESLISMLERSCSDRTASRRRDRSAPEASRGRFSSTASGPRSWSASDESLRPDTD